MIHFNEEKSKRRSQDLLKREAVRVAQYLSNKHGIPYIDLTLTSVNTEALGLISEEEAKAAKVAAYHIQGRQVDMAALSPLTDAVKKVVDKLKEAGHAPLMHITTQHSLDHAWKLYAEVQLLERTKAGQIDIAEADLGSFVEQMHSLSDTKKLMAETLTAADGGSSRISSILEIVLSGGISLKASDIHIEPEEDAVRVRYRLDGILHEVTNFDAHTYKLLSSRIKLLSSLKLNVGSKRQDGRFSIKIAEDNIDIRTSIIPGSYGEAIVMRILNPKSISMTMENLGIPEPLLTVIKKSIAQPNGMILTTGPTGSGKTTSLYSFLAKINQPGVKIITIEDPIEYHMSGVVQTQVDHKKGYTFLEGLKSAMRQDPDIIMVGEIRDEETAGTAIDAALTGHLVFSTLHTNNAAGAIPRLLDLMVNPKVIGPALTLSLAQRLLRRLCTECKVEKPISPEESKILGSVIEELKFYDRDLTLPDKLWSASSTGCKVCDNIGYKGRLGVYEGILIDDKVEAIIPNNPSEHEIWKAAVSQKIPDMMQDGVIKILEGITTLEELGRVINFERRTPPTEGLQKEQEQDQEQAESSFSPVPSDADLPPLPPLDPVAEPLPQTEDNLVPTSELNLEDDLPPIPPLPDMSDYEVGEDEKV